MANTLFRTFSYFISPLVPSCVVWIGHLLVHRGYCVQHALHWHCQFFVLSQSPVFCGRTGGLTTITAVHSIFVVVNENVAMHVSERMYTSSCIFIKALEETKRGSFCSCVGDFIGSLICI